MTRSRRSARATERGGHGEEDVWRRTGDGGGQPWEGEMRRGGGGMSTGVDWGILAGERKGI